MRRPDKVISAYQTVTPLLLAELWALPVMLELALIENLRRIADRMMESDQAEHACSWAARMTDAAEKDPSDVVPRYCDMARSRRIWTGFCRRAGALPADQGASIATPLQWIDQRLLTSL